MRTRKRREEKRRKKRSFFLVFPIEARRNIQTVGCCCCSSSPGRTRLESRITIVKNFSFSETRFSFFFIYFIVRIKHASFSLHSFFSLLGGASLFDLFIFLFFFFSFESMRGSVRTSTGSYDNDGGTNSIVEQTTDMLNRFRNSIVRNRKERLLDEDLQATENIVNQLHFTELISRETLTKLISQGDSMQRSFRLIHQLEKEIKDIADDLDQVNGSRCCGLCSKGSCFGCFSRRKKKKSSRQQRKDFSKKFQSMDFPQVTTINNSIESYFYFHRISLLIVKN